MSDLGKLPKWASMELKMLREENARLKETISGLTGQKATRIEQHGVFLREDRPIHFQLGAGDRIDVHLKKGEVTGKWLLEVLCIGGGLLIAPIVSNHAEISIARRW